MQGAIEYKSIGASEMMLKDIDEKQGRILGYFSKFGNIDSDKDMIMPGAFTKTLKEGMKRIKHLYQHDPLKPLAGIKNGRLIVTEDKDGLAFDSTISQTSWGRDTIKLYVDGVVDEHSIGFNTKRSQDKKSYRELTELMLWEGSTVTWGANEFAGTSDVKSMSKESIIKKMDVVLKSLRSGTYENEEIFDVLELYFKQLQNHILQISTKSTTPDDILTKKLNDGDRMFLKDMIPHHQMAIKMSGKITKESDLYDFAQNIIKVQSNEITDMKKWLDEKSTLPEDEIKSALIQFNQTLN